MLKIRRDTKKPLRKDIEEVNDYSVSSLIFPEAFCQGRI